MFKWAEGKLGFGYYMISSNGKIMKYIIIRS